MVYPPFIDCNKMRSRYHHNFITFFVYRHYWGSLFGITIRSIAGYIITVTAFALSALWVAYPEGLPKKEKRGIENNAEASNTTTTASTTASTTPSITGEAYCDLIKHILLLLFTCGIWNYIWIYRMTGYTNSAKGEEYRDPTKNLLLCMFIPYYNIYWTYKTAQRVDKMAAEKGVSSDLTTLCLILAIFVPIIPPILLQNTMNKIVTADDIQPASDQREVAPAKVDINAADEIKKYKELLDSGAITQEEFDAKKKQLLIL